MTHTRRTALTLALAGGGAMALAGRSAWAATAAAMPHAAIVPLIGGSDSDDAFLAGIRAGLGGSQAAISNLVRLEPGDPAALGELAPRLTALKGAQIVGLLDEARHTVVAEILRDLGAKVICTGWHSMAAGTGYDSTHLLVTAPRARGIGTALAGGLTSAEQGFMVHETAFGADQPLGGTSPRLGSDGNWAGMMGEALGRIAIGNWSPGSADRYRRVGVERNATNNQGLVSFAAQM